MAHPLRGRILSAVSEKNDVGASVGQLAERLREPKRRIRYHLDALVESDLVAVASERKRRGVVERFYRVQRMPWLPMELNDRDLARRVLVQALKAILADASEAVGARTFGLRLGNSVIRIPAEVDEQGWKELLAFETRAINQTQEIIARARARLESSGGGSVPTVVALLLFEVPPWP